MSIKQLASILTLFLLVLPSCKKAVVDLKALKSVDGFSVDQTSVVAKQVSNPSFSVSGRCNKNIPTIEVSFDGGAKWYNLSAVSVMTNQCVESGSFSAVFSKDLTGIVDTNVVKSIGGLYFRASGEFGVSERQLVVIRDGALGGLPTAVVASAAYGVTGGGYKVRAGILSGATNSYQSNPAGAPGYTIKNLRVEAVK